MGETEEALARASETDPGPIWCVCERERERERERESFAPRRKRTWSRAESADLEDG